MALAALALTASLVAASGALPRGLLPELPRCYWIAPPISHYQPRLLNSGVLNCELSACRASLAPRADAGWVCFFARPY